MFELVRQHEGDLYVNMCTAKVILYIFNMFQNIELIEFCLWLCVFTDSLRKHHSKRKDQFPSEQVAQRWLK